MLEIASLPYNVSLRVGSCQRSSKSTASSLKSLKAQKIQCYSVFHSTAHILPHCLSVSGWEETPELGMCFSVEVTGMNRLLRTQATWIKSFPNRKKKKPTAPFWYAFPDVISRTTQARSARGPSSGHSVVSSQIMKVHGCSRWQCFSPWQLVMHHVLTFTRITIAVNVGRCQTGLV